MINTDTDSLEEVERFLKVQNGPWSLIPDNLNVSSREDQTGDEAWPEAVRGAVREERQRLYERSIRLFARQRLLFRG
jgi:hypothetical protein